MGGPEIMETDATLLDRWRRDRDPDAFAEVVHRHAPLVFNTCSRVLRDAAHAEEVTQECFIELLESRATNLRSVGGWLHTLAVSRALDRLRAEGRLKRRESRYAETSKKTVEPTWNELADIVDEAIRELPEDLRDVIVVRFLRGKTYQEAAAELGLATSTVQLRIAKGIDQLRQILKNRGLTISSATLATLLEFNPVHALPVAVTTKLGHVALSGLLRPTNKISVMGIKASIATKFLVVATAIFILTSAATWVTNSSRKLQFVEEPSPNTLDAEDIRLSKLVNSDQAPASTLVQGETRIESGHSLPTNRIASVEGTVKDSDGNPLADWQVRTAHFDRTANSSGANPKVTPAKTASNGVFRLEIPEPGQYRLEARDALGHRAPLSIPYVEIRDGESITGVDFIWKITPAIKGWITDPDCEPIVEATVQASTTDHDGKRVRLRVKSDAHGFFIVTDLPDSENQLYNLTVQHEDFLPSGLWQVPINEEQMVALVPCPMLAGRVIDARTREPIRRFKVAATARSDEEPENSYDVLLDITKWSTDLEGRFNTKADGINKIVLAVSADEYRSTIVFINDLGPGESVAGIEVALKPSAPIEGIVVNESNDPVDAAIVHFGYMPPDGYDSTDAKTSTDNQGRFFLKRTPLKPTVIAVKKDNYAFIWIPFAPDAPRDLPMRIVLSQGGSVEGNFRLNGSRFQPFAGAIPSIAVETPDGTTYASVATDPDGHFLIPRLFAGEHTLKATLISGNTPQYSKKSVAVENGKTIATDIDFFTGDCAIGGIVLVDELPPSVCILFARLNAGDRSEILYKAVANYEGTFTFEGLPEASYELSGSYLHAQTGDTVKLDVATIQSRTGETVTHDFTIAR
jgi:RNA polymerase sigma factor (sigma-70 family)